MRVLIIEDELPASKQITKIMENLFPEFVVLNVLDSIESSIRWLQTNPAPDVIFMDIQIADGLSFEIFKQVNITSKVVFTTAFDQYAVQAFRVNAIDYLLKPIEPEELKRVIHKIRIQTNSTESLNFELLNKMIQKEKIKERFLVRNGAHLISIASDDIFLFQSSDGLTQAITKDYKKYFVDYTLEKLEDLLQAEKFYRINRNLLIHQQSIQQIVPHLNGRLKLKLEPPGDEDIYVSRERVQGFKEWLGG
ncbi:MAG: response regulator transcription factor [Saprospiraceae bacterium]|nr:response regulator transcription factor [Saprospiraceae bacterium]